MRNSVIAITLAALVALAAPAWTQDQEQAPDPLDVLRSDAELVDKMEACRTLSTQGGVEAVPVLAPLLLDEKLSHMVRMALEPMPYPEAGKALRDALAKTTGNLRIGMIHSLGMRQDKQAVPAMIGMLNAKKPGVAPAAARALGKIATPEACKALMQAIAQPGLSAGNLIAFCDGALDCAVALAATGDEGKCAQACGIYAGVSKTANAPAPIRAAALRGQVLTSPGLEGVSLLAAALRGDDCALFDAALRAARELGGGDAVSAALAETLPALAAQKKVRLMQALGQRGGSAAGPAVLAEATEGPTEVRVAALNTLAQVGYVPALDLMCELAWTQEGDLAEAARNGLSYFPGEEGDTVLRALFANKDAKARGVAVELIGQGGLGEPVPLLMKAAKSDPDESVRITALKALQECASITELPGLVGRLLKASAPKEAKTIEQALGALCARLKKTPSTADIAIQKAVYGAVADGPSRDVTKKVAKMVAAGSVTIDASNANFGDPAPGVVKNLRVDYTENGVAASGTVGENGTLTLKTAAVPASVVDAFLGAFAAAQGDTKLAVLRLLGTTGSPKAFDTVLDTVAKSHGASKDAALRVLCEWPSIGALPTLMGIVAAPPDDTVKVLALRGAVRLLKQSPAGTAERLDHYATLMEQSGTPEERKLVLSGIAQVRHASALELALAQSADEAVKAEAIQAAITIAKGLGTAAKEDKRFFNGKDLAKWDGDPKYWRCEEGVLVGQSKKPLKRNGFIWSEIEVRDFYLAFDVLLEPNTANSGVQFRSKKINEHGQAKGYQADIGKDVWGRLYHEQGRGKLDWKDRAEKALKPGEWNRYEILAVGPAIWTAINGTLGVAFLDLDAVDERSGGIALQVHAGPAFKVQYRFDKLVHDPAVTLGGLKPEALIPELFAAPAK